MKRFGVRVYSLVKPKQLALFDKYLRTAAATLRERQNNGTLHLDLDLEDYFRGVDPQPAALQITAPVGSWKNGAVNHRGDVRVVQELLQRASRNSEIRALDPRGVDGLIARPPRSSSTVASIKAFEGRYGLPSKGVIEPGSPAWHKLLSVAGQKASGPVRSQPGRILIIGEKPTRLRRSHLR